MQGLPQPEDASLISGAQEDAPRPEPVPEISHSQALAEDELDAALQLLVERAQYITGATGAALALPNGDEMVCRASAGSCAPAVGASLQVRSGLTGESMARRQLLRCDNAESDPRVNLEACRALGIASIVVLPLVRANGEVRGLFELFSDHPYAFEERDLVALERMAGLTATALDLAEQRHGAIPPPAPARKREKPAETPAAPANEPDVKLERKSAEQTADAATTPHPVTVPGQTVEKIIEPEFTKEDAKAVEPPSLTAAQPATATLAPLLTAPPKSPEAASAEATAADSIAKPATEPVLTPEPVLAETTSIPAAPLPESMLRVRKCEACGFPISEGRTICLDCEKKQGNKAPSLAPVDPSIALAPTEDLPPFLANAVPVKQSWLADHVNLLAILVLIVAILVAIVVFR
jgi:putative methionine-R-sulfoxide reductase with GAF domain